MAKKSTQNTILLTIFLTVFIDMLGISIIIPVLPALFFTPDSDFFSTAVSQDTRSVIYGFLIASYPFMQFFGAPLLGGWSDRYGRRPLLSISLIGTLIGYLLFAYAIITHNLYLLFFSRMLPGFTGGNISIILSAIADVSKPEDKAKNFGLVGAAFGIGFILGPTIGGILADDSIVSWFSAETPFYFTAVLTLLNLILVQFFFPETLKEPSTTKTNLLTGLRNFKKAFSSPNLRLVFAVVLLISLGFTFFTQFFSVYLIQKFDYAEKDIGFLFGWIGIWLAITQGLIVRRMSGRVASAKALSISIIALSIAIGLMLVPNQSVWFYLFNPLIALSYGITSPNLTTVVSEQASSTEQGQMLGLNQSMQSIGTMVPPVIAGYLNTLNGSFPLMAGSLTVLAGWLVFMVFYRKQRA